MTINIAFDNSYARLPDQFFTRHAPSPVKAPSLIAVNDALAAELGMSSDALRTPEGIAALAGNIVPDGAEPLAQAYAGHQFGGWSPQLGDGRAILLGEVIDTNALRRDIQLKGSGRTRYSRMGDGRAWLGPVLREYIVSEAMHALGVPTTRALAAVATGEIVQRESAYPGAVLTRVASSHIRVGTFQFFAARRDLEALHALTDYVIERHYPQAQDALGLLDAVIARQAELVAQWMSIGFIHGVMNTDNCHIAGETIDYGPCAFMDSFHPATVYSSIDHQGRYAYGNQPEIAVWNLAQLATSLLPLIDDDQERAVEKATASVHRYPDLYRAAWLERFRSKLGLATQHDGDKELIEDLLSIMARQKADFTNTFRALSEGRMGQAEGFETWLQRWKERTTEENAPEALMQRSNPAIIPRNHRIEQAIQAALSGDYTPFFALTEALNTPFDFSDAQSDLTDPPEPHEVVQQTFCGT